MKTPISTSQYTFHRKCSFIQNTSLTLNSNKNISLEEISTYIQPLLKFLSVQDITKKLFLKKKDKVIWNKCQLQNSKNLMIQLILLFKEDSFLNTYQISSQLQYLYHLLKVNLHYHTLLEILKGKEESIQQKINTTISTPSKIDLLHIQKNDTPLFHSNFFYPNYNGFFGTWFVFCNIYCRDTLLNYLIADV